MKATAIKRRAFLLNATIIFFILNPAIKTFSQNFNKAYWYTHSGDTASRPDFFTTVVETYDSSYIACGISVKQLASKLWIIKLDENGDTLKEIGYGNTQDYILPNNIQKTSDSNYVVFCSYANYTNPVVNAAIYKFDNNLDTLWHREYTSGLTKTYGRFGIQTSDGGFLLIGSTTVANNQPFQVFVVKTDSLGNEQWQQQYGGISEFDEGRGAVEMTDKGYMLVTRKYPTAASFDYDIEIIRTDTSGATLWQQTYGTSRLENSDFLLKEDDNNFYVFGQACLGPGINDDYRAYILKIDSVGSIKWDNYYGIEGARFYKAVLVNYSSALMIAGVIDTNWAYKAAGWVVQLDTSGYILKDVRFVLDSTKYINSQINNNIFYDIFPTSDIGFILAGYTSPGPTNTQDGWIVKMDSLQLSTSIAQIPLQKKTPSFTTFPNPSKGIIFFIFSKDMRDELLNVVVYDVLGKEVFRDNFFYLMERNGINIGSLNAGIYFLKVESKKGVFSQKIIKR